MKNKLSKCKKIAAELELDYDDLTAKIEQLMTSPARCAVVGMSGSGKSYVIRHILGLKNTLMENSFSKSIAYSVEYSLHEYAMSGSTRLDLADLAKLDTDCEPLQIFLNNDLLKNKKLTISEVQEPETRISADSMRMFDHLGIMDSCIVVIDAQMPLSRTDAQYIAYLRNMGIPTYVIVCKMERLMPEDRAKVETYIREGVYNTSTLTLYCPSDSCGMENILNDIRGRIEAEFEISESLRSRQCMALITKFLESAMQTGSSKLVEAQGKLEKVSQLAQTKRIKLLSCYEDWDIIRKDLDTTADRIEDDIQKALQKRELDMLDEMQTLLRRTQDVRTYWQVDLPALLDRMYRHEIDKVNTMMRKGLEMSFSKLQKQLKTKVDGVIVDLPDFQCPDKDKLESKLKDVENLSNLNKLQTTSRVVAALGTLVAGTALASIGTGGILMAVSAGIGIISDIVIKKTVEHDRKKIAEILPNIIKDVSARVSLHVSQTARTEFSKLHALFMELRDEWKNKAQKTIDTQTENAEKICRNEITRIESVLASLNAID